MKKDELNILLLIDNNIFENLYKHLKKKPYLDCHKLFKDIKENRYIIHNLEFFIEKLNDLNIVAVKFKNDYIYLLSMDDVYKYAYGYSFKKDKRFEKER